MKTKTKKRFAYLVTFFEQPNLYIEWGRFAWYQNVQILCANDECVTYFGQWIERIWKCNRWHILVSDIESDYECILFAYHQQTNRSVMPFRLQWARFPTCHLVRPDNHRVHSSSSQRTRTWCRSTPVYCHVVVWCLACVCFWYRVFPQSPASRKVIILLVLFS